MDCFITTIECENADEGWCSSGNRKLAVGEGSETWNRTFGFKRGKRLVRVCTYTTQLRAIGSTAFFFTKNKKTDKKMLRDEKNSRYCNVNSNRNGLHTFCRHRITTWNDIRIFATVIPTNDGASTQWHSQDFGIGAGEDQNHKLKKKLKNTQQY